MNKKLNKVLKIISTLLISMAVILAVLLSGVKLFGIQVYTVLSGSMEPEYQTGSVIYVKKAEIDELKVNDVITFMLSKETSATHRIIEIIPDGDDPNTLYFRTKGDANDTEDAALVHEQNVIGKPIFTIPYLGYVANFIQNPPGKYLSIAIGLILIIFIFMIDVLTAEKATSLEEN